MHASCDGAQRRASNMWPTLEQQEDVKLFAVFVERKMTITIITIIIIIIIKSKEWRKKKKKELMNARSIWIFCSRAIN